MKKKLLALFIVLCSAGFAQQQGQITRTHYYFSISNTTDEQALQQIVAKITPLQDVAACKYKLETENKTAEIIITVDKKAKQKEGEKDFDIISIKNLIIDKGLNYTGFNHESEKISN